MTETLVGGRIPATRPPHTPTDSGVRPSRQWTLDALRVAAIVGVVAIHVVGMLVSNADWHGTRRWWAAVVIDLGAIWTVPVFVMISGALVLAPRAHAAGPADFYRKRFLRILPALVVWHVIYLLVVRAGLRGERLTVTGVAHMLLAGKVYTALYFLWLIAGLYAIAPVLAAFLRGGGRRRAVVAAAVALSWTVLTFALSGLSTLLGRAQPLTLGALTQWWPYVGYFLAGWALHQTVLGRRGIAVAVLIGVVTQGEIIWQYGHAPEHRALQQLLPVSYVGAGAAVVSVCLFLAVVSIGAHRTPGPRTLAVLRRLSDASFGVFLVHLLLFEVLRQLVPAVMRASSLPVLLGSCAVVLVASFAVSIGAAKVPYVRAVF